MFYGIGKHISSGIKQFLHDIGEEEVTQDTIGDNRANERIVQMLKREGHYRSAKAIKAWDLTDPIQLNLPIATPIQIIQS